MLLETLLTYLLTTVNQAVHVVSMTKNGSRKLGNRGWEGNRWQTGRNGWRKLGASSWTQWDVAKVGRVSIQNRTMETRVMVTDRSATMNPALDVCGYSNNDPPPHWAAGYCNEPVRVSLPIWPHAYLRNHTLEPHQISLPILDGCEVL